MLDYRIPIRGHKGGRPSVDFIEIKIEEPPEAMGLIEGKVPDSKEEWWIAKALWKLGHDFSYQVPIFGGYNIRGGQILDFIVHSTAPKDTIIQYNGSYWHQGNSEEIFSEHKLRAEYGDRANILVMWDDDAESEDAVYQFLRKEL
jgi:hypothetical protein